MRFAFAVALLVSCLAGCGDGGARSFTAPEPAMPSPSATPTPVLYTATLSASSACAKLLPAGDAVRVYQVTRSANDYLHWSAPTVIEPEGHRQISTLTVDGNTASLTIGTPVDPQSDEFNGIWEDLGGGREFTISGRGSGHVEGSTMSGTFEGDFNSWYENAGATGNWTNCHAADHRFTLALR